MLLDVDHLYAFAPQLDAEALDSLGARTAVALGHLGTAEAALMASREAMWSSEAGVAFRGRVDGELGLLRSASRELDGVLSRLRVLARRTWTCAPGAAPTRYVAGAWTPSPRPPRWSCSTGGGTVTTVGAGGRTSVDPEGLSRAAVLLDDATGALDHAQLELNTFRGWHARAGSHGPLDTERVTIGGLYSSGLAPARRADDVRGMARSTRTAAAQYAEGESRAHAALCAVAGAFGTILLVHPLGVIEGADRVAELAVEIVGRLLKGEALDDTAQQALRDALTDLVKDGGTDVVMAALVASFQPLVQVARLIPGAMSGDPVVDAARVLTYAMGPPAPVTVTALGRSRASSAPRGAEDLLAGVAAVDNGAGRDGSPAAPPGTITIERVEHADGPPTWVVEIPGTQTLSFYGPDPMDGETNIRQIAGVPDAMTDAVLQAMRQAGIPPDEPVVLAGHSQGGMTAMSVAAAAAGAFVIGGVVTAGSPSIGRPMPAGVPLVRLENTADAIPQLDGRPSRAGLDTSIVRRETADTITSHHVEGYRVTGREADAALAEDPGSNPQLAAITRTLGADDATGVTRMRFQATRDAPAVLLA